MLGEGVWRVVGMRMVPTGGVEYVGTLHDSFSTLGGGTAKSEWLGVMDHQHTQDTVGRLGSNVEEMKRNGTREGGGE